MVLLETRTGISLRRFCPNWSALVDVQDFRTYNCPVCLFEVREQLRLSRSQRKSLNSPQTWKDLHKVGGASFVVAGVLYLVNFAILAIVGPMPSEGQAFLKFVYDQRLLAQIAFVVFLIIDVLLVMGVSILYFASTRPGTSNVVGPVLGVVALTIDLVNTVLAYTLLGLSASFAGATTEGQRIAYGVVGELVRGMTLDVGTSFFLILFSISVLVMSMSTINFLGKPTRYLGIAAGLLGIAGGLLGIVPLSILWPVWFLAIGYKLFRVS